MSKVAKSRRRFSPELKAEVIKLAIQGGRSVPDICKTHELPESSVYAWVRQAKVDAGKGRPDELTTAEKQELARLRQENRELRRERDFLKSAAAYFAKTKQRGSR